MKDAPKVKSFNLCFSLFVQVCSRRTRASIGHIRKIVVGKTDIQLLRHYEQSHFTSFVKGVSALQFINILLVGHQHLRCTKHSSDALLSLRESGVLSYQHHCGSFPGVRGKALVFSCKVLVDKPGILKRLVGSSFEYPS